MLQFYNEQLFNLDSMYQKLNYYADFLSNAGQYDTYRTLDYGFSFDKDYKDFPCRCGAKKCVGFIVNSQSRWRIKKLKKSKY